MIAADADRSIESLIKSVSLAAWNRKFLVLLSFAVCFCLTMYWVLGRPLLYEGTAVLITGQSVPLQAQEQLHRDGETPLALYARVAESDEVIQAAAVDAGLSSLISSTPELAHPSVFLRLRRELFPDAYEATVLPNPIATEVARIRAGLIIRGEQNSGVIRISYRDLNPEVAARLVNALALRLIQKQTQLATRYGAADFFQEQRTRFEQEAAQSARALQAFSARTSLFSIQQQRELLLKRGDVMAMSIAASRGVVAQKTAERQALVDELRKLSSVARSPYISSLVDAFSGDRNRSDPRIADDRTVDPPALLTRVYQETISSLFRASSELFATESLQKQQADESAAITRELTVLLASQEEFTRLKADVDRATQNLEFYSRRMVEEQINSELARAQFSPVKILQKAVPSSQAVSPNFRIMAAIAAVVSGLVSIFVTSILPKRYRRINAGTYNSHQDRSPADRSSVKR